MDNNSVYEYLPVLRFRPHDCIVDTRLLHWSDQTGTGWVLCEADPADLTERCRDRVVEAMSPVAGDATSHFCAWPWFAIYQEQKRHHQENG